MIDKIKSRLDDYLEFDSNILFQKDWCVRIFGGAIRDSIADMEIHDVDILMGSKYFRHMKELLEKMGYEYVEEINPKDWQSVYTDLGVISEPHTHMKNNKMIQLIRPTTKLTLNTRKQTKEDELIYKKNFHNLISSVDISCCGVSYDGVNLYENCRDAVLHCVHKKFKVNDFAPMCHEKRVHHRAGKLVVRGWSAIEVGNTSIENRDMKIENYLNNQVPHILYTKEY